MATGEHQAGQYLGAASPADRRATHREKHATLHIVLFAVVVTAAAVAAELLHLLPGCR